MSRRSCETWDWHWSSHRQDILDEAGSAKMNVRWGEISFEDQVA
jgi:hypothetical protein